MSMIEKTKTKTETLHRKIKLKNSPERNTPIHLVPFHTDNGYNRWLVFRIVFWDSISSASPARVWREVKM